VVFLAAVPRWIADLLAAALRDEAAARIAALGFEGDVP
jgi:hypothetical protein